MKETQEKSVKSIWFLAWEVSLEKKMATHPSILAWKIPWAEEPDGLQSMGPQRVGINWVTEHAHMHSKNANQLKSWFIFHGNEN